MAFDYETQETERPDEEQQVEFDINDPRLLEADLEEIDPDADADDVPPPPPDQVYTVKWDFMESDPEKQFIIKRWTKGFFLMTTVQGTIVEADTDKYPRKLWENRKIRTTLTTITMDGRSSVGDWLKSIGRKDVVEQARRLTTAPARFELYKEAIIEMMVNGAQGRAATQWQASYKRVSPFDGREEYVRPGGKLNNKEKVAKDHPINRYRGMRAFLDKTRFDEDLGKNVVVTDDNGNVRKNPVVTIHDPDLDDKFEARASAEVTMMLPFRGGSVTGGDVAEHS